MSNTNRRTFLKQSASIVPAIALAGCAVPGERSSRTSLDRTTLRSVAGLALPVAALGPGGVERVLGQFEQWLAEYDPVAEMDHGYLTAEIDYTAPDPGARWSAQLEALELESEKRHGTGFDALPSEEKVKLVKRQIGDEHLDRLPDPSEARHVVVGLLAYFYGTPEANDLCYGSQIGKYECRGLANAPAQPTPLERRG